MSGVSRYQGAALLIVAHGSSVNGDSATPALNLASSIESKNLFQSVHTAFYRQPPFIRDAVGPGFFPSNPKRVFVAPLFLSHGYFTRQVVPAELNLRHPNDDPAAFNPVQQRQGVTWLYCAPFGTHPRLVDVVLARAEEALAVKRASDASAPAPSSDRRALALCLAAHGTPRDPESRQAALHQADVLRQLGRFAEVHALFMEEEPRISDLTRIVSAPEVVVVPFFIGDGQHTREDVPVLLGEEPLLVQERLRSGVPTWLNGTERGGKRIWYGRAIGTAPMVEELVLERVKENIERPTSNFQG